MRGLQDRAAAIARAAQRRTAERIGAQMQDTPGVSVEVRGDGVVLSGRRLVRRWLNDASLRFIAGTLR